MGAPSLPDLGMLGMFLGFNIFIEAFPSGISQNGMLGSEFFLRICLLLLVGFELDLPG
jgi:hypothetical protein